jgi:hypothetical protein
MDSNADGILTYDEAMSSDENKHNVTHLIIETIFSIADVDNDRQVSSFIYKKCANFKMVLFHIVPFLKVVYFCQMHQFSGHPYILCRYNLQITSDEFIRTFDGYSSGSFNRQQKDDPLVDDVISKISTKTLILFDQNSDQKVTLDEIESFLSAQGQVFNILYRTKNDNQIPVE